MGMSASQMRFCMITGRKSDVEFEGQQINQQRTTLASESSAANEQLLNLTVPTPPSTDDYSKTIYTYSSNGNTNTITGVTTNDDGTYTIDSTYGTTADAAATGMSTYTYDSTTGTYHATTASGTGSALTLVDTSDTETNSALSTIFGEDYASATYSSTTSAGVSTNAEQYYEYTIDGVTRYVKASDLADTDTTDSVEDGANSGKNITYYYVDDDADVTTTASTIATAIAWSDSGRMESFTNEDGAVYSLSVATSTDESAYSDAFNEYEYQKALYDQEVTEVNSKICIIETEDKKLELKLKNLDTQQEALSTEMDSVKKVIDKNIENSFKTFA